jgi:cation:H+ antiporter
MDIATSGWGQIVALALLWLAALAAALYSSEHLVKSLSLLGHHYRLTAGLVGLLVALGADSPEITSALVAVSQGAGQIGLGVVVGSNIYNLAGLLGLAAVLAGGLLSDRFRLVLDGGANVVLTLLLVALVEFNALHTIEALLLLSGLACYFVLTAMPRARLPFASSEEEVTRAVGIALRTPWTAIAVTALAAAAIIGASDLLVNTSIHLGPRLGIPASVTGIFILPIATSLPNTWAAVSLARKGLASAAISATFNSNSINAAVGAGIPALFFAVHASAAARTIDTLWLLGMTLVAIVLLFTRVRLARWEGSLLLALYAAFVVVRLAFFV